MSARIDHVFCNSAWATRFDQASMKHLPTIQSDHCPLLISSNGFAPLSSINKPFRFQAAWMTHENFQEFIQSNWASNSPLIPALEALSNDLQQWNKEVFHNIFREKIF
ncbi:Protein YABBY 2 [Bienertia sinuspersici]